MRVTIDLDTKSIVPLTYARCLGYWFFKKHAKERETARGFHLTWSGLPITFEESIRYRRILGDDPKRIRYDENGHRKHKQVLFTSKEVKYVAP